MVMLKNRAVNNASWIIFCKILQSILSLVIGSITARYLGPSNYGIINYAASLVAFVTPIMYLGLNGILVHEIIKAPNDEGKILGTSLIMSFISAFFCIIGVFSFAFIANKGEKATVIVCLLYSLLLFAQSIDLIQYWFQAKLKSKYTSVAMLISYVLVSVYKIFLLMNSKSVYWFALSNTFDYLLIAVMLLIIYKHLGGQKLSFSWSVGKSLLSSGKHYIVSNMMITVFAQTDKIMINLMIDSKATGIYSAAVVCAGITSFIFSAIIDSFRPIIFEYKNKNKENYIKSFKFLYCIVFYLSLAQCIVMTFLSTLIIDILYGKNYAESASVLKVIVWYITFSYIGSIRNVWILAENKQRYLWIINASGAFLNVALNLILIPVLGCIGAAIASCATQFFTNFILGYIIKPLYENNKLFIESLNPKILLNLFNYLRGNNVE